MELARNDYAAGLDDVSSYRDICKLNAWYVRRLLDRHAMLRAIVCKMRKRMLIRLVGGAIRSGMRSCGHEPAISLPSSGSIPVMKAHP